MKTNTRRLWEQLIGYAIATIGVWIFLHTLINWRTMPQAFIRISKETVKTITVQAKPLEDPHTGPTKVIKRWHSPEKGYEETPNGGYQFQDSRGVILILHFCDSPPPDLVPGSIVDVHFQYLPSFNTDGCVRFAWSSVLKESK